MCIRNIKGLNVIYDDYYKNEIDDISEIISNNFDTVFGSIVNNKSYLSLVQTYNPNAFVWTDFYHDFYNYIKRIFNPKCLSVLDEPNLLPGLYAELLLRENNVQNPLLPHNGQITDEMLNNVIAYKYYEENGDYDSFVEYLKYRKDTDKIKEWLKETCRFDTYNFVIGGINNYLEEKGFSLVTYPLIDDVVSRIGKRYPIELPRTDIFQIDDLFYEFLDFIKAPKEWKEIYNEVKDNKLMVFKKGNGDNFSMCYNDKKDGKKKLLINDSENIITLASLVHEFIHYVSFDSSVNNYALSEFPSIFFERVLALFLSSKGFNKPTVDEIFYYRNKNNNEIIGELYFLFRDILYYKENGYISRERKEEFWKSFLNELREKEKKIIEYHKGKDLPLPDLKQLPKDEDIPRVVDEDCDNLILLFIKNNIEIIDGYQYLLGSFLANKIDLSNPNEAIRKMIYITKNLSKFNTKDIIEIFDIDLSEDKSSMKKEFK